MANVKINNITYENISSINIPKADGDGYAEFSEGSGSDSIHIGQNTTTPNILNLFYALENGTAKTGEFTLATTLPNTETLIFDSGLSSINGIFLIDTDYAYDQTVATPEYTIWGLHMENAEGLDTVHAYGLSSYNTGNKNWTVSEKGFITRGTYRIDSGKLYITAQYNNHATYTPFLAGHKYIWVVW